MTVLGLTSPAAGAILRRVRSVRADRRSFLTKASTAMLAAATAVATDAPSVIAQPKAQWRMSTTWTPALDHLQGAAQRLAKIVEETSGGRFRIDVFPGGQIMQPFECFDAASKGTIEAFMGPASYWVDKEPALEWFTTIPFGMNPEGMAAWYHQGDGLKLWEETYAAFNLVPRPSISNAPQMAGWVQEEDQHDRRLQRAQDAHWHGSGRQGHCQGGCHCGPDPG